MSSFPFLKVAQREFAAHDELRRAMLAEGPAQRPRSICQLGYLEPEPFVALALAQQEEEVATVEALEDV